MAPASPSLNHDPFSATARFLAHAVAFLVIRPIFWIVYKLGYGPRLWGKIGQRVRRSLLDGHDFGDYQPTEHDVIVCTYAKCGTNWTMQIAHQIATLGEGEFRHIHDVVPWPDFAKQELTIPLDDPTPIRESPTGLRVIKTHLERHRVPYDKKARYICVLRDPKDAFASNYPFIRDVMFGPLTPPVEIWLELFCSENFFMLWGEHLASYWKERATPNFLILTFEEMKADLEGSVKRIADFMGVTLDEEQLAAVCEKSSFAYMKGIGDRFDPPALTPFSSSQRTMIRRGVSGGSSELLSPEQQRFVDEYFRADLAKRGCDFPYDETYADPEFRE